MFNQNFSSALALVAVLTLTAALAPSPAHAQATHAIRNIPIGRASGSELPPGRESSGIRPAPGPPNNRR